MSSSPDQPRRPRRTRRKGCFLKTAALLVLVLGIGIGGVSFLALQRLPRIAKWAIERSLPGVRAQLKDVTLDWPGRISVRELTLTSKKTGNELLSLQGGSVTFEFQKLPGREITEVTLEQPVISLTPEFLELLGPGSRPKPAASAKGDSWRIGKLTSDYGELQITGLGPEGLTIHSKFTFEMTHLFSRPAANHRIVLWDMTMNSGSDNRVMTLDLVETVINFENLAAGRIESLKLNGGRVLLGESLLGMFQSPQGSPATSSAGATGMGNWTLGTLEIQRLSVDLQDTRAIARDVSFDVNTTLTNIPLSKAASTVGGEVQRLEIADLEILSPHDPLAKVMTIRSLAFEFTLTELLRKEIRKVEVTAPSIYVSPDLFWYMDDMQSNVEPAPDGSMPPADPAGAPVPQESQTDWLVKAFLLTEGRLILGSGGNSNYGLPLTFRTNAENLSLANLASLKAQAILEIPAQKYTFEDYQLEFTSREGELRFAYPPEKQQNNLVGTLQVEGIRWRQYQATEAWVAVTFDRQGINGTFGGEVYQGYASGGFSFFFNQEAPWIGWVAGKSVDLRRLTRIISPENFQMTGPLDFTLQVDAQRKNIQRMKGNFETSAPGTLKIKKLDDMLAEIPDTWPGLKRDLTTIGLETLRDFDYETCRGNLWFVESQGVLDLRLQGPNGSRNLEVVLHGDNSPKGRWKKPKPENP